MRYAWFLALVGCGGAQFSAAEATGDGGVPDAVQASPEAAPQGEDSGPDAREELAVHVVPTHDGGEAGQPLIEAAVDAGHEAEAGPACVTDLSGVGTGDFRIGFTITTTDVPAAYIVVNVKLIEKSAVPTPFSVERQTGGVALASWAPSPPPTICPASPPSCVVTTWTASSSRASGPLSSP